MQVDGYTQACGSSSNIKARKLQNGKTSNPNENKENKTYASFPDGVHEK